MRECPGKELISKKHIFHNKVQIQEMQDEIARLRQELARSQDAQRVSRAQIINYSIII